MAASGLPQRMKSSMRPSLAATSTFLCGAVERLGQFDVEAGRHPGLSPQSTKSRIA